jgi:hypothetical protein
MAAARYVMHAGGSLGSLSELILDSKDRRKDQASVSTICAPFAARRTASQPSFAAVLVSYASPVATTCR